MPFDPDAYLKTASAFDPDAYLKTDAEAPQFTISPGETVGYNAANAFGVLPALTGVVAHVTRGADYAQTRDAAKAFLDQSAEQNPRAALAGKIGSLVPETILAGGVGRIAGAGAKALGVGETAAKLLPNAARYIEESPIASSTIKGALSGAGYGAASGAGEALSEGKDILPAAAEGSLGGAVLGGGLGAVTGKLGKMLKGAPLKEEEEILRGLTAGEGTKGSATVTAKKLVANDRADILETLRGDPELRQVIGKPAKEVKPILDTRLEKVGSQLDPHYDVVDKTTGGVSIHNLVNVLDDEVARLKKTPLNEQYIRAVNDIKKSALDAWAPELMERIKGNARMTDLGLDIPKKLIPEDIYVPTRDVRAMVTRLQTRGSQVINPLNPSEATIMKNDMAQMMKGFIDAHLDRAAEEGGEAGKAAVDSIRDLNKQYSAYKNMQKAVEQRSWKEDTGSKSVGGHLATMFQHGGALAAVPMLLHGNVPGAIGSVVAGHVIPKYAPKVAAGATAMLATLAREAEAGNPKAVHLLKTLAALKKAGTAGAGSVGSATTQSLAQQQTQE